MAINNSWLQSNQVCYSEFLGAGDVNELVEMADTLDTMFNEGQSSLYWVVDFSQATQPITDMQVLQETFAFLHNPKLEIVLVVGASDALFKFITSTIAQLFKIQYRHFDGVQAALDFLNEHNATHIQYDNRLVS